MKKKIAIFQKNLAIGGIQRSLINLLNLIDCEKYQIDLYLFSKEKFYSESLPKNVNIIYLKKLNNFCKIIPLSIMNKFYKNLITKKYDVAIDFDGYSNDTALAMINCDSKKRVMWIHQDLVERKKSDKKFKILYLLGTNKYKYVDQFVCVSQGVKSSFETLIKEKGKCIVIPNIIPAEKIIEMSKENTNFRVNQKNLNLVSVGRLCYQKGFDILINYMKDIIQYRNDTHLYIIGSGPDEKKLKKMVKNLSLENNICFLGSKTNPFNIIKQMDLFVLTSRYEGQGMVILEAKVLGLPICITNNLEKYNEGIKGSNNFVNDIINYKKNSNKKVNYLKNYNSNIIKKLYEIFNYSK